MASRATFLSGCTAFAFTSACADAGQAESSLGHLDHSYWTVADGAGARAAFRTLGFTLSPKPKVQADGALSTFATFNDFTYLEIVEDHSKGERAWIASGANPEAAGGSVTSCTATATALGRRGITMKVGQGAGFCYASFPDDDKILGNIFVYSFPLPNTATQMKKAAAGWDAYAHHANGALGLRESWIAVPDLEQAIGRFTQAGFPLISGEIAVEPLDARGAILGWGSHRIVLLASRGPTSPLGGPVARLGAHPVGVRLAADMSAARRVVEKNATAWGEALLVGPADAKGAWIAFAPGGTWTH